MSIYTNSASSTPDETAAYVAGLLGLLANQDPVDVLRKTPSTLEQLLASVPATILAVPEAPGKWAIRDVFAHLADSELVGGVRLRMVLAHDRPTIIGYDQDLWSDRLRYREVDPVRRWTSSPCSGDRTYACGRTSLRPISAEWVCTTSVVRKAWPTCAICTPGTTSST